MEENLKIVVIGAHEYHENNPEHLRIIGECQEIGELAAKNNFTIITGGSPGFPAFVAEACSLHGGKTYAITAALNEKEQRLEGNPVKIFSKIQYLPRYYKRFSFMERLHYRIIDLVQQGNILISIGGAYGTAIEFCSNQNLNKCPVFVLESGGFSGQIRNITSSELGSSAKIFYYSTGRELMEVIILAIANLV